MTTLLPRALVLAAFAACALASSPVLAQKKIGGTGAPQAVACEERGGTMVGTMCELQSGRVCEAMALARDGLCYDADGALVPETVQEEVTGGEEGAPAEGATPDAG